MEFSFFALILNYLYFYVYLWFTKNAKYIILHPMKELIDSKLTMMYDQNHIEAY